MLNYSNNTVDPFPDVIDPVTGEWLPKSYSQVRQEQVAKQERSRSKSLLRFASTLFSMIK